MKVKQFHKPSGAKSDKVHSTIKSKPSIIHNPELAPREKIANPFKTIEQREEYARQVAELRKKYLQPKPKSYNAQGFAKDSVWLDVLDAKFPEKFQDVFDEHINGWAGKSFKKQKTEAELNMEWRIRLREKQTKELNATSARANVRVYTSSDDDMPSATIEGAFKTSNTSSTKHKPQPERKNKSKAAKLTTAHTSPAVVGVAKTTSPRQHAMSSVHKSSDSSAQSVKATQKPSRSNIDVSAQQKAIEMYWLLKQKKRMQEKQQQNRR